MATDRSKTPLTIEQAKKVKQAFQKAIEDGDIVAAKALVSKQLENVSDESGSYQDKPYLFQATGTDSNTTETPTAPVAKHLELRGNTVIFNQLVDTNTTEIIPIVGHKYLTMINGVKSIITPEDDTPISVSGGTDNVFDLTRMFGIGKEPISVVGFNRLFPLPYYAYNAGELKSCQSNKLITIGYKQFENLNQFIEVIAGQTYRLMYWNGTALAALTSGSIEEYDGAQTLIQTTTYDNLSDLHTVDNSYPDNGDKGIKLTDETHYVKIINSSNTNILFNIAWDGSRSDYESYVKHEYTLPNWTDGKSAGDAYDSYYPDGTKIQRIQVCSDASELNWVLRQDYPNVFDCTISFVSTDLPDAKIYQYGQVVNIVCPLYTTVSGRYASGVHDKELTALSALRVKDLDCATAEQLKQKLSGVPLYYELAEPIITTGHQTFPENVEVDDFGTMKFTTTETESASNPIIPQGNQFFYPADYALLIDDLNNYTNGDVNVLAKKSDVANKQDKLTQSTDLTPTTQTLTLTANTRYALGTLTALNITFPASGNDGDEIIIGFVSGSTATTLTRDTTNAIYNFSSVGTDVFVEFNAQYKASISKWVVYSAETAYTAPQE